MHFVKIALAYFTNPLVLLGFSDSHYLVNGHELGLLATTPLEPPSEIPT